MGKSGRSGPTTRFGRVNEGSGGSGSHGLGEQRASFAAMMSSSPSFESADAATQPGKPSVARPRTARYEKTLRFMVDTSSLSPSWGARRMSKRDAEHRAARSRGVRATHVSSRRRDGA